jgi:hypothetical protein
MSKIMLLMGLYLTAAGFPAFADLLTNDGFETGDFTGWTIGGNSPNYGVGTAGQAISGTYSGFGSSSVMVHSGTFAGYAVVCQNAACPPGGGGPRYFDLSQIVNLVIGQSYSIGFYIAQQSQESGFGTANSILVNGSALSVTQPSTVTGYFQVVDSSFVATAATDTIDFRILDSGYAAGISFDDFYLDGPAGSPVPEPAAFWLFATALVLVRFAWRRGIRPRMER